MILNIMKTSSFLTVTLLLASSLASSSDVIGFRGPALHFLDADHPVYFKDALLVVNATSGTVLDFDEFQKISEKFVFSSIRTYSSDQLITPGFIDCHSHAPQIDMIGSYGYSLEEWLHDYTFPSEAKYMDVQFAESSTKRYFNQLLRSGITSALIYNAIFSEATAAVFNEALKRNMRIITGINGMSDCAYAPEFQDKQGKKHPMCNSFRFDDRQGEISAKVIDHETRRLYHQFHGSGRLLYALMPRFLTTSTPAELETWAKLYRDLPEVFFHTHIAENLQVTISSVARFKEKAARFYEPDSKILDAIRSSVTQLEIWNAYGLLTDRTSFAHGIHLTHLDYELLRNSSATLCHCPTSNLFLDSGLFNLGEAIANKLDVGVGTDIGAGTTFELLSTMGEVYKVAISSAESVSNIAKPDEPYLNTNNTKSDYRIPVKQSYRVSPFTQLYMLTLGTARQLRVDNYVGNFVKGKEADFVVLDLLPSPLHARRLHAYALNNNPSDIEYLSQAIFGITAVGHDRSVAETYILGKKAYDRELNYLDPLDNDYFLNMTDGREIVHLDKSNSVPIIVSSL